MKQTFDLLIARFPYGGPFSAGVISDATAQYLIQTVHNIKLDKRFDRVDLTSINDTPITMGRNAAACAAVDGKYDFLMMIDSDMQPDCHPTEPNFQPFWPSSIDFLIDRYDKGPATIFAPYCGGGGHQVVFVCRWRGYSSSGSRGDFSLELFSREEAAMRGGIEEVAAGPTGLILFDVRGFGYIDHPYFEYGYSDHRHAQKTTTEDIYTTRNMSINGVPQYCNWNAWAAHLKTDAVPKPQLMSVEAVGEALRESVARGWSGKDKVVNFQEPRVVSPPPKKPVVCREPGLLGDDHGAQMPEKTVPRVTREVCGHIVQSLGHQTQIEDLHTLNAVADILRCRDGSRPLKGVEVGSWVGESAIAIATGLGAPATLWCVDPWSEEGGKGIPELESQIETFGFASIRAAFDQNTRGFSREQGRQNERCVIEAIQDYSPVAAGRFADGSLDMVFLDPQHTRPATKADIEAWLPKLRPDGVLCLHDYLHDMFPGVTEAVHEAFPDTQIEHHAGTCVGIVWLSLINQKGEPDAPQERHAGTEEGAVREGEGPQAAEESVGGSAGGDCEQAGSPAPESAAPGGVTRRHNEGDEGHPGIGEVHSGGPKEGQARFPAANQVLGNDRGNDRSGHPPGNGG